MLVIRILCVNLFVNAVWWNLNVQLQ